MLTLLGGFLATTPAPRGRIALWATAGIVFSLAGDVLFAQPGDIGFILGLGGFLLAHVAYAILFLGAVKTSRMPRLAAIYGLWWFALLALLLPHLGTLAFPVVVYGGVLGLSAASALGTNRTIAVGAALFLLSDSVLACKLFLPGFHFWQQDFAIMVLYCAGQGLIALGVVRATRARRVGAGEYNGTMSERVTKWIDGYRKAWLSNDEADIRALFTDDAVYEYRPNDPKALRGADAIVAGWLESADGPDDTTWEWHPVAEEGDVATIQGLTVYRGARHPRRVSTTSG